MQNASITRNLNPQQLAAVEYLDGPLLILAGAGSGKTRVLTHRMANIIAQQKALPEQILCVTFTNKAAKEMEQRIYGLLSDVNIPVYSQLWISTFHSFCVRILKKHITLLDYKSFFGIYDSTDQLSQIKKVMNALNINDKMFPAKSFQSRISHAKMMGLTAEDISKSSRFTMDPKSLEVFKLYEQEMKKANALDFDDLLLKTYELFRMYPDLLKEYQNFFQYIMVDEYQDTNHIQYLLMKMLASGHKNICVVGDEDQSIYSWRGADIQNILSFEKDFPEAKVIKLEENYRSTGNIVNAATAVIKNNSQRKDKTLFTSNPEGALITIQEERNEYDEAKYVAKSISSLLNQGEGTYNDFAIFYRTNAQSRVIEEQLRLLGLPYKIIGGVRFYERMEIKDMLSYFKLGLNPNDDVAFKRIVNVPTRGIGKTTVEKIEELSMEKKLSMTEATQVAIDTKVFNAGTTGKLRRFLDLLFEIQSLANNYELESFYTLALEKTGYLEALKAENTPEADSRIENLEELDNAIAQFCKERGEEASLQTFLEEIALVSDVDSLDQEVNHITLMTLHISKGLEFPYVFIVGLEENLFPSNRGSEESDIDDLEEERRLAYVGMTRARKKLWLTYTKLRRIWGQEQYNPPSRFLKEIPKDLVEFKSSVTSNAFVQKYGAIRSNYSDNETSYGDSQDFPDYEGSDYSSTSSKYSSNSSDYRKGMKVRHPTFGVGSIYEAEGSGEQQRVSVLFSDNTIKKFVVKYARLERV